MSFPKFLRVAVLKTEHTAQINLTTSVKIIQPNELGVSLANIFAHKLGFFYDIVTPSDNEFGIKLPNGSWTGLISLLLHDKADIITNPIMLNEQRKAVVDFTYPYNIDKITFASRKPEYYLDNMALLKPFSKMVWGTLILSFLVMSVLLYVLFKGRYSFSKVTLYLYGILFCQTTITIHPQRATHYFLLSSWTIGILFLGYSYTSDLLSSRTIPSLHGVHTITELADAVSKDLYTCHTLPGGFFLRYLTSSMNPKLRIIGENLRKSKGYRDIDEVLSDDKSPMKPVFITGTEYLLPFKIKYYISDDTFFSTMPSVAVRKDFCCKEHLNRIISYIWAAGLYQKILDDFSFKSSMKYMPHSEETLERKLSVTDISEVFIFLICGYILSAFVFLIELAHGKYQVFKCFNKTYVTK